MSFPHLLAHTRYISDDFFLEDSEDDPVTPALFRVLEEGKLERLDICYDYLDPCDRSVLVEITNLPSLTWLKLTVFADDVYHNILDDFLLSPKLRDLDLLGLRGDSNFDSTFASLVHSRDPDPINHLVTLRVSWPLRSSHVDLRHLQKLVLVLSPWRALDSMQPMKVLFTEISRTLTHLSLSFGMESDWRGQVEEEFLPLFIHIQELRSLISFRPEIKFLADRLFDSGMDLIHLLLRQLSIQAPLEEIHLYVVLIKLPPHFTDHPGWESFRRTLSTRHPHCRLMVHIWTDDNEPSEVALPKIDSVSSYGDVGSFEWEDNA